MESGNRSMAHPESKLAPTGTNMKSIKCKI